MAVVNANYEFIMVDVGANGRVSYGGVFANTKFCKQLKEKALHIPEPTSLPGCHNIVGDDAFPLMDNLMKPYAQRNLSKAQDIYNYRVSRARRVVENTFGIMASRFRILLSTINLCPSKASTIVLAGGGRLMVCSFIATHCHSSMCNRHEWRLKIKQCRTFIMHLKSHAFSHNHTLWLCMRKHHECACMHDSVWGP